MKSFDVILEARVVVMASSEPEAIQIATQLVRANQALLVPTTVRDAYPKAWQPMEGLAPSNCTCSVDLTKVLVQPNAPVIDDEVPF